MLDFELKRSREPPRPFESVSEAVSVEFQKIPEMGYFQVQGIGSEREITEVAIDLDDRWMGIAG
jgi:hypothetical protein